MQNASIYFGNVVDVNDTDKLFRIRATINGYTEKLEKDNLPWYFPFFGVNYLPILGDVIPIIIFNGNFSTGFFNPKVDIKSLGLDGTEYANYLELYKRGEVSLTYKESTGIELINEKTKLQLEKEKASLFVDDNQIVVSPKRIDLGSAGEATILGDKGVEALAKIIEFIDNDYVSLMKILNKVKAVSSSPFLAPIKIALTAMIPAEKLKHSPTLKKNEKYIKTIQSKKTFIE